MRQAPRQDHGREDAAPPARQTLLGRCDGGDHAFIGFQRGFAEGEDAVLQQHQPLDLGIGFEHPRRFLGEIEARHDERHHPEARAIHLAAQLLAFGLVGQAQHRSGMGVVDELARQEGVQQGLDRGIGRARIEQIGALHPHHVLVGKPGSGFHPQQRCEPHRRQPGGLDLGHVPAAALDAENLGLLAQEIGQTRLDRGVAATMEHQLRLAAQKPRGIDAQSQVGINPLLGITRHQALGLGLRPAAFQTCLPMVTSIEYDRREGE